MLKEEDIYSYYLNNSKQKHPPKTKQQHKAFAIEWSKKSRIRDNDFVKNRLKQDFNEYNERFGVLSLTINPLNEVMWKKYSDNYKGFVVGFNPLMMFPYIGGGDPVTYYDELPIILPHPLHSFEKQYNYQVFAKLSKWSFEEEYRTHKFQPDPLTLQDRIIKLPHKAMTKIIIGENMPQESIDDLLLLIPVFYRLNNLYINNIRHKKIKRSSRAKLQFDSPKRRFFLFLK